MTMPQLVVRSHQGRALRNASVVDKNIYAPAKSFHDLRKRERHTLPARDIARDGDRLNPAARSDLFTDRLDLLKGASDHRDARSFARKLKGDGTPDAASAAGHKRDSVFESH